jgi:hypothetical protein
MTRRRVPAWNIAADRSVVAVALNTR